LLFKKLEELCAKILHICIINKPEQAIKEKNGYFSIRLINASLSIALTHFTNAYMSWEGLYMFRVIIYKKSENVPFFWPILVKNVQVTLIFSCVEGMESYLSLNMFVIVLIYVVGDYVF